MVLGRLFHRAPPKPDPSARKKDARPVADAPRPSEDAPEPFDLDKAAAVPPPKLSTPCPKCGAEFVQPADWFATHYDFDCPQCGTRSRVPEQSELKIYREPVDKMRQVMQALKTRDGESRGR